MRPALAKLRTSIRVDHGHGDGEKPRRLRQSSRCNRIGRLHGYQIDVAHRMKPALSRRILSALVGHAQTAMPQDVAASAVLAHLDPCGYTCESLVRTLLPCMGEVLPFHRRRDNRAEGRTDRPPARSSQTQGGLTVAPHSHWVRWPVDPTFHSMRCVGVFNMQGGATRGKCVEKTVQSRSKRPGKTRAAENCLTSS